MSTYGTALVADLPAGAASAPAGWEHETVELGGDLVRLVARSGEIDQVARVEELLAAAGSGRAAVAEDHDEYGALWVVLSADHRAVWTVHRRYVLPADPGDPEAVAAAIEDHGGTDPREADVAGEDAAAAAARLFGVPTGPMVEAERASASAHLELGLVGGPFPWWDALRLPWPGG